LSTCLPLSWLLDLYPDPQAGVALWLIGADGQRRLLRQPFPVTFYAAGPDARLRALQQLLDHSAAALLNDPSIQAGLTTSFTQRRDLFASQPLPVLSIQVARPSDQPRLFQKIAAAFPDLTYYDADIPLHLRYAARYNAFPLARCHVEVEQAELVRAITFQDSPWDLDPIRPPLRILRLEPDVDPAHRPPRQILVHSPRCTYRLELTPARPLLVNLRTLLQRHDPDLILTTWGDTWLLPRLIDLAESLNLPLPLNRDPLHPVAYRPERSYFSYGQIIHRGRQVHLFGRCHIDCRNAMLWDNYELEGVLETARVTSLPLQISARVSPGTGISAMQILTALRQDILVPWHKQQTESPKAAFDLFAADQGGLVYQPLVGLHRDVAEIDFTSMYPGIMVHFNISPETVHSQKPCPQDLARLPPPPGQETPGLIPQTLAPLLDKRLALKARLSEMPRHDPRRPAEQARAAAHKWLLVTCFGYLGYKNARFGRIEAHEAVTAYGREALLRAKETAEDLGYTVLHMYVDGLWVQKPGADSPAALRPLLAAIQERTGLPIALDGIYRWVAFLPSRVDDCLPVPNRYFGVFQDGEIKVRGIEARRGDTPPFIAQVQMQMLELLAAQSQPVCAPLLAVLRRRLSDLRAGRVPLEALLVSQRLSREVAEYRQPSPAARAAAQLEAVGKTLRPGQRVRFVYTRGEPGVYAWDLPAPPNPASLDLARYTRLLLRAAAAILQPLGMDETTLEQLSSPLPARQLPLQNPSGSCYQAVIAPQKSPEDEVYPALSDRNHLPGLELRIDDIRHPVDNPHLHLASQVEIV
jgi:DNA polymerase-2